MTPQWWVKVFLHNWGAHFLLPFGEILDRGGPWLAKKIFEFHDKTVPEGAG